MTLNLQAIGVDISVWQDSNSTPQMFDPAKTRAKGGSFVGIKVSQATWADPDFLMNWATCRPVLYRMPYHFLTWDVSARLQAETFWRLVETDLWGVLPLVCDFEWWSVVPSQAMDVLYNFTYYLDRLCNPLPQGIYTAATFWAEHGTKSDYWKQFMLWLCDITGPVEVPEPWEQWDFHQYTFKLDGPEWGAESLGLDGDRYNGTLWEMIQKYKLPDLGWTGEEPEVPEEPTMTDYTKHAIGLYTKAATWTNKAFNFVIGHAGESWNDPNPNLKPIEERAAQYGQAFGALWDFDVDFYSYNQYLADEAHWPPVANDQPLQKAIRALTSRNPKFVVVRLDRYTSYQTGKPEDPGFISYAAQTFMGRLGDWLARNKPGCQLVLATSHDWIQAHAPNVNNWGWRYPTMVIQKATLPLISNAYPQETDKVKNYISTRPTNEFWWHYDTETVDLILFYLGDKAKFAQWIGQPAADTTPPGVPAGLAAEVTGGTITLSWVPSTDGPVGYQVWLGGERLAAMTVTTAVLPGTYEPGVYQFGVSAFDAAGNESAQALLAVTVPETVAVISRAEFDALRAEVERIKAWAKTVRVEPLA
jgi:hypothetical protein